VKALLLSPYHRVKNRHSMYLPGRKAEPNLSTGTKKFLIKVVSVTRYYL
jgi:hypothetical protein